MKVLYLYTMFSVSVGIDGEILAEVIGEQEFTLQLENFYWLTGELR